MIRIAQQRIPEGLSIFDLDREFHHLVVSAGAGPRLTTLHQAIEPQAERYWRLYASSIVNNLTSSTQEHEAIIEALLAGDPGGLEEALKRNWENGCLRLARVIDVFGERGSWQNRGFAIDRLIKKSSSSSFRATSPILPLHSGSSSNLCATGCVVFLCSAASSLSFSTMAAVAADSSLV